MDGHQFDVLARSLAAAVPRRAALRAAPWIALVAPAGRHTEESAAKRRRKKKPKSRCRAAGKSCTGAASERCCGDLICSDNNCVSDPVCLQDEGGSCRDKCDCRFGLECSDRANNTCRQCTLLQNPCESHEECCLASAACGSTIFSQGVCCQQLGFACGLNSDCCANTGRCDFDGCGGTERVCCHDQGQPCNVDNGNCECCDPLRCLSGTCQ